MPAQSEFKTGFWIGLGVVAALAVWTLLQVSFSRAVRKNG